MLSTIAVGAGPRSLALADVNADGKLDLLTANRTAGTVSVLLGNGLGSFAAAAGSPFAAGSQPFQITTGDFNHDGKVDVAVTNLTGASVSVLNGNGTGALAAPTAFAVGSQPEGIAAADANEDGLADLLAANAVGGSISLLRNNLAASADLSVTKTDGVASEVPGTGVSYTITVSNAGPNSVQRFTLVDTLPGALTGPVFTPARGSYNSASGLWTGAELVPGGSVVLTVTGSLPSSASGSLVNTATVSLPAGSLPTGVSDPVAGNNTATDTDTLVGSADLSITKSGTASVVPGNNVTYTITVTNAGPSDAAGVSVADLTPAGLTFVSNSGDCTTAFPCSLGALALGATRTITAVFKVNANYSGASPFTNTATVSATTADPSAANNSASAQTTVAAGSANLSITKTGTASTSAGGAATYTITVSNAGPSDAAAVSVADVTPAGLTFVSNSGDCTTAFPCSLGTVAAGATRTITASYTVNSNYSGPSPFTNTATVSSTTADPSAANNSASAQTTVAASADVSITKTGTASVVAGNNVSYTLTVSNAGPSDAASVNVTDATPAGLTFVSNSGDCTTAFPCSLGAVPSGATRTITAVFKVNSNYSGASPFTNTASVSTTTSDPSAGNNSASAQTTVSTSADLSITKNGTASAVPGSNVTYTITVTNSGPSDAATVSVADATPAGLTFVSNSGDCATAFPCALGTLTSGATRTITAVFKVNANYSGASPFTNTATVSSATTDPSSANNSASAQTTVLAASADLGITKSGTASVVAGNNVTYTVTVTNAGPSDAAAVSVADTTPAGLTFVSNAGDCTTAFPCSLGALAAGATRTITAVYTVGSNYSGASPFTNTATVSSSTADPSAANNSASAQTTVSASADLGITKTGSTTVVAGNNVTYTITVTNAGPSDAASVSVADTTPAGLTFVSNTGNCLTAFPCSLGSIPSGATRTITSVFTVGGGYSGASPFTNTASVSSTTTDPTPANNSASAQTTVSTSADLSISKSGTTSVAAGGNVTYTITVTNAGPSSASAVSVADVTPAGLTFVSNAGDCVTLFPCSLGTLAAGATRTITAVFTVGTGYSGTNPFTNTATVSSATADPAAANNSASAQTTVSTSADLAITKAGTTATVPGGTVTYTITVTNAGPSNALAVSVADPTPAGLTFVSNAGDCLTAFPCSLGTVVAGATRTITATYTVAANYSGTSPFTNTATVSSTTADPAAANNSASAQTTVSDALADLTITKSGTASVVPGNNVTYTITVTNAGPSDAASVSVADVTPAGLSFVSNSGSCVTAFPCSFATIASGGTRTITAVFKVDPGYSGVSPFTNTATVSATTADPAPGNNSAAADTTVLAASADVSVSNSGTLSVLPGNEATYTVTVTNAGPSDATVVGVTLPTPAGLTFVSNSGNCVTAYPCALGTVPAGATRTITTVFKVGSGYAGPSPYSLSASVSTTTADPVPANNSASASTTVGAASADLGLSKSGPASIIPGQDVVYTLTVTNAGPSDAAAVSLADLTPAGLVFVSNAGDCVTAFPCSLGNLTAGATRTISATFSLPPGYSGSGPITNTATVTSSTSDPSAANNTALATSTVEAASADLSIGNAGPASLVPGNDVTYTLTITNAGPSNAAGVSVTDPTPSGLSFVSTSGDCTTAFPCALGAIPAGESRTITAVFHLPLGYVGADPFLNTATVSATTADPVSANNSSTVSTSLPGADFYTVTPCRVIDTRNVGGGGPLASGGDRDVTLVGGACGVPATARAVSFNITVAGAAANGNLRLFPAGATAPLVSSINFLAGVTRANNGVIQLGTDGKVTVRCNMAAAGATDFIIDVNGYFQ